MPGNPLSPSINCSRARLGSSSNGLLRLMRRREAASDTVSFMYDELAPGPSPPSNKGLEGSTMTFAASKLQVLPSPWQVSQAPNGLLKEKERGSSCGTLVPQLGQASFCE